MTVAPPVLAAGAVCWREGADGRPEIVVVHRPRHRDVSLPKGKVDPGETLPETAVREIAEETGLAIGLGIPLGVVKYRLPSGRRKEVTYWSAEVDPLAIANTTFEANDEVEELRWVTVKTARKELSYQHDLQVLDRFQELYDAGDIRTFAVIALRHGKALPPTDWDGPDATRPLMQRGVDQAAHVAAGIAAYRPTKLISSTAIRCLSTIAPTAQVLGMDVKEDARISQDAYTGAATGVAKVVGKRLDRATTSVLCSHGPVLPQIVAAVGAATGTRRSMTLDRAGALATGEFAVLHLSVAHPEHGVLAVELHSPPV